jgi:hypothetical protein
MMLGVSYDEDDLEEKPRRTLLKKTKRDSEPVQIDPVQVEPAQTEQVSEENLADVPAALSVGDSTASAESVNEIIAETKFEAVAEVEILEPLEAQVESLPEVEIQASAEPAIEQELKSEPAPEVDDVAAITIVEEAISEIAEAEVPIFVRPEQVETSRNMQDLFGARPRTEIDDESRSQLIEQGHEIVRRSTKNARKGSMSVKTLIKPLAALIATVLGVFLIVGPAGISFTLPEGGLRTSLSSAENALVIVKESPTYQIGDSVVAILQDPASPDYFATIAAQSDTEYVLTENNLYHTALREDVKGKVLLVMPGIGFLLHKLGL